MESDGKEDEIGVSNLNLEIQCWLKTQNLLMITKKCHRLVHHFKLACTVKDQGPTMDIKRNCNIQSET